MKQKTKRKNLVLAFYLVPTWRATSDQTFFVFLSNNTCIARWRPWASFNCLHIVADFNIAPSHFLNFLLFRYIYFTIEIKDEDLSFLLSLSLHQYCYSKINKYYVWCACVCVRERETDRGLERKEGKKQVVPSKASIVSFQDMFLILRVGKELNSPSFLDERTHAQSTLLSPPPLPPLNLSFLKRERVRYT